MPRLLAEEASNVEASIMLQNIANFEACTKAKLLDPLSLQRKLRGREQVSRSLQVELP